MSHASGKRGPTSDVLWLCVLFVIGNVGGIILADMWIRNNEKTLIWAVIGGLSLTVLGAGYAIVIKNPFRFLLIVVGGVGVGLMVRGYLAMV